MHLDLNSILATKIYRPLPRTDTVERPRLIERLNAGMSRKLTLVSAAAGFGKTALISEWTAGLAQPTAWFSLDERDKEPQRFLTYFVAALQKIEVSGRSLNLEESVIPLLQSPQPLPFESVLIPLLNEISLLPDKFLFVLDDYHLVDTQAIDEIVIFLIEHMPPQMHLVITTREDPPFPLARYRAKGQMAECRDKDLRFTPTEATRFFNQVMGLTLSAEDVATLESRTEGWIAGLQLAALSLQGRQGESGTSDFIEAFSGGHHFILDYLIEEVLNSQPEPVRNFLLQTSILKTLNGPLCDAVTEQNDGKTMLGILESGNLFTISLDDQRHAYRYHHLFADVLQSRLHEEQPDQVAQLHLRASEWYEQHDRPFDGIRHALAAEDFERVAKLIEQIWPTMHRNSLQTPILLEWLEQVPDELVKVRPVLSVGYGWMLLNQGNLEAAVTRLNDAESWLEAPTSDTAAMIVVDEDEFKALLGEIASARSYLSLATGDVPNTILFAQRALDLHSETDFIRRGPPSAILGLAHWAMGDLEAAFIALKDAMDSFQKVGNIVFALSGTYGLADIRIAQGRLQAAIAVYEQALQIALAHSENGHSLQGTADLYLGLAALSFDQGNREKAAEQLQQGEALGQAAALPDWPYRLARYKARLKQAEGDFDGALALLDQAEKLYVRTPVPDTRPIAAEKARCWIAQGNLARARDWAGRQHLTIDAEPNYFQEFEHITFARLLIAENESDPKRGDFEPILSWLQRLLNRAEAGGRIGSVIEILLLQTGIYLQQNNTADADSRLHRALTLAEPEGAVQLFVHEGAVILARLNEILNRPESHSLDPSYLQKLQAAFGQQPDKTTAGQALVDPLSERELDVLRLLGTELNGPQIAERLMVSLNTMRTHTKNIYSKLGVSSRRAAVRRAEELELLG